MSSIEVDPLAAGASTPESTSANPWPGLASYTEDLQHLFFGRERETAELLRLIQRETLTVLFGRSGLGKTSLLRAAVIPRLREQGYFPLIIRLGYSANASRPVEQVKAIALAGAKALGLEIEGAEKERFENNAVENGRVQPTGVTLWEFFHTVEFWGPRNDRFNPVLIFDQFEEVFTIGQGAGSVEFLEQLADLVENRIPRAIEERIEKQNERLKIDSSSENYKVLLSLREDFVPKLDSLRTILPAVMRNRLALNPLDGERALSIVAQAGGRWVSEDVAHEIVAALAGRGRDGGAAANLEFAEIEPAYLSVLCHELFRRMEALGLPVITRGLVEQEHGGILERLYERSFADIDPAARLFVEDRLVTASGFRASVPLAEALSEGISRSDLDTLVDRRLLRFEDRLGAVHVELSHDLLTRVVQNSRDQRRVREAHQAELRHHAQLHRQLLRSRIRAAAAGIAALVLTATLIYVWFAYWHHEESYSDDFVKRFGEITPLGRVMSHPLPHRSVSFRYIRDGFRNKIRTVQAVDSTGRLTTNHNVGTYLRESGQQEPERDKECQWDFIYDRHGRVVYEIARDRRGRMIYGLVYSPSADFARTLIRNAMFVGPDGYPQPQLTTRAEYIAFQYDSKGYEIKHSFTDRQGKPAPGPDGAYARRYEYDSYGRNTKETSLDQNDKPIDDNYGNATMATEYGSDGRAFSDTALDADGHITLGRDGYAKELFRHDQWGNTIERRYLDEYLRPVLNSNTGAYVLKNTYDDRGNELEERAYAADGITPVETNPISGLHYHLFKTEYDSENRAVAYRIFDATGKPMTSSSGWHETHIVRDSNGFVREYQYFDINRRPVELVNGYQKIVRKPDDSGEPIEERYFHADGSPSVTKDGGYHIWHARYERGKIVELSVFGIHGEPVSESTTGAHMVRNTYDRFNSPTSAQYYDSGGGPTLGHQGYFAETKRYESRTGWLSVEQYWGMDAKPIAPPDHVASRTYKYDDRGMLLEIRNFGVDGSPVEDTTGVAVDLLQYNNKRLRTRLERFGLNNKPAADRDGVHLEIAEYASSGRMIVLTQLGTDGRGVYDESLGIATKRSEYTAEGTSTDSYYAADGSLRNTAAGFAIERKRVSETGYLLADEFFDAEKQPTFGPGGYRVWERRGNTIWVDGKQYDSEQRSTDEINRNGVPLIYVSGINPGSIALSLGFKEGDVLWMLGRFHDADTLERLHGKAKDPAQFAQAVESEFIAARTENPNRAVTLIMLRNNKPVEFRVPPLNGKLLGFRMNYRVVPFDYFESTIVKTAGEH